MYDLFQLLRTMAISRVAAFQQSLCCLLQTAYPLRQILLAQRIYLNIQSPVYFSCGKGCLRTSKNSEHGVQIAFVPYQTLRILCVVVLIEPKTQILLFGHGLQEKKHLPLFCPWCLGEKVYDSLPAHACYDNGI